MKFFSTLAVTAVSAARVKRNPADDGWTLIPASHGISEGTHYKINGSGTADEAVAYCAEQGGFAPMSTNSSHMYSYRQLSGADAGGGYYWPGFRKTAGSWNADPWSGDASDGGTDQPSEAEACGMAYADQSGNAYIYQLPCSSSGGAIICLKDANAESAAPAEINNIVDAWNDMVNFPNASTHGCQCLNLLSDADTRYPGKPRDELDHVCLDWQNAIKCQRFEGGVCGPSAEEDLPSYTNYANCTLNVDPCAIALCEINRKFATDVNDLRSIITPTAVENPAANCTRANVAPNYNSCCFTDIFSSIRYNSVGQQCVNGTVESANPTSNVACQSAVQDVVFIIDGSGSVSSSQFQTQLQFTRDMASEMGLYPSGSRASVVQFSTVFSTQISWTDDAASFEQRVMAIRQSGGGTRIQGALNYASTNVVQGNKRPGIPMLVYLMTDGRSGDTITGISTPDSTFALGIGPNTVNAQLVAAASSPASTYVADNISFDNLAANVERFATNVCTVSRSLW